LALSLVVDSVSKRFGPIQALDRVSFEVAPGRIFGLLGANGAGKTTSMRIVLDILRADSGAGTWQGTPNTTLPRDTWGYLPIFVAGALRIAARIYSAGVLLYGQRPGLRGMLRAVRVDR
jgi:ABC-type multidrug transport system ATPase subunit